MDRIMARATTIDAITEHTNADALEIASVGGWRVVTQLGAFHVGDRVLFCEIDAALPVDDERFAFLAPRGVKNIDGTNYHVLKTAKLRGVLSQGLLLPLDLFPDYDDTDDLWYENIGIHKYDPPIPSSLSGKMVGAFPEFGTFGRTDAERVQNLAADWDEIVQTEWIATEKIDGTSTTYLVEEDGLRVCSRNWELVANDDLASVAYARRNGLVESVPAGYQIQGELAGPGIQTKTPIAKALRDIEFFVFGVFFHGEVVPRDQWPTWCLDRSVPVVEFGPLTTIEDTVEAVNALTSVVVPGRQAEGLVFSAADGIGTSGGVRRFKAINNKYLLKNDG